MSREVPEARSDGVCAKCIKRLAVTTDGVFCLKCLRSFIRKQNPIEYHEPSDDEIDEEFDFDDVVDDLVKEIEEHPED